MVYKYRPEGVCSQIMEIDINENDNTINSVRIIGGCPGNTLGISKLVEGMKVEDVINRFKGIKCGLKPTSCPDQLSRALENILKGLYQR